MVFDIESIDTNNSNTVKEHVLEIKNLLDIQKRNNHLDYFKKFFTNTSVNYNENKIILELNKKILNLHIFLKEKIFIPTSTLDFKKNLMCITCDLELKNEGIINICEGCGYTTRNQFTMAWSDVSRVHANPIYFYDRTNQFKSFLISFQGKNSNVDYSILKIFKNKNLMNKIQFFNYLKKYTNEKNDLENIHSLYYKFYNIKPPVLGDREINIISDFEYFTNFKFSNIKYKDLNISNQFLAYQLLNKNNIKTLKDDVLLTEYFGKYSDSLFRKMMKELGWKYFY